MRARRRTVVLVTLAVLAAGRLGDSDLDDGIVRACGPFITFPVFTSLSAPDDPLDFAGGNLGVIQPGYRRRFLVAAWRTLEGRSLTPRERAAYATAPSAAGSQPDGVSTWVTARNAVEHLATLTSRPMPHALLTDGGRYVYITNCGDDAFRTAAATLADRRLKWGDGDALRAWVRAQDMVFANCGRDAGAEPAMPQPLDAGADPGARADRAYQIAAATFYAGNFTGAERAFSAIAADPASPWRTLAPYLAVRAVVRQGTLGGTPPDGDRRSLERAERMLDVILENPHHRHIHDQSRQLRQFVRSHLRPAELVAEIAVPLERPDRSTDFAGALADLDYLVGWRSAPLPDLASAGGSVSQLLEWLAAVRDRSDEPAALVARWRQTPTPTWLVAVMLALPHDATEADEMLAAAAAVEPGSAAYPTVSFHRARILIRRGRLSDARAVLSAALSVPGLSRSNVNLLRGARFLTARTLDEFVEDGMRSAVGEAVDVDDQRQLERAVGRDASFVLDRDVIAVINERLPVETLQRLADHPHTSGNVRRELNQAIFVRLWLLARTDAVRAMLPTLRRQEPALVRGWARLDTVDDQRLNDEVALLLLRTPGLRPYVAAVSFRDNWRQYPGSEGLNGLSSFRDNWWCRFGAASGAYYTPNLLGVGAVPETLGGLRAEKTPLEPTFLSEPERQRARDEHARLAELDSGSNEIARRVLDWARRNPEDPRVPEALHRVVGGLKVGCSTEGTGAISRAAFQLLHSRYGKTRWAARTPYWYR